MLNTFKRVVTNPAEFFESIAKKPVDYRAALLFGAANIAIAFVLSELLRHIFSSGGFWPAAGIMTVLSSLVIGVICLPIGAAIFYGISMLLGGKPEFGKSLEVICYLTAISMLSSVASALPFIGPYLGTAILAYTMYAIAVASIKVCSVQSNRAYIFCSIVGGILVLAMLSSQMAAMRMHQEISQIQKETGINTKSMNQLNEASAEMQKAAAELMKAQALEMQKQAKELENQRNPSGE